MFIWSICKRFYARWANSGKIKTFQEVPLFHALVRGEPFTQRHEILSQETSVLGAAIVKISWS